MTHHQNSFMSTSVLFIQTRVIPAGTVVGYCKGWLSTSNPVPGTRVRTYQQVVLVG